MRDDEYRRYRAWHWDMRNRHRGHDHRDWAYEPSESRYQGFGPYGERSRGGWTGGDYLGPTMSYGPEIAHRGGELAGGGRWHEEPDWYRGEEIEGARFATFPEGPHRGRGPKGYARSDARIQEDVCEFLTDHPGIDASEITVQVTDGVVFLDGTVDERRAKRWAEEVADQVRGVRDVMNRLRLHRRQVVPAERADDGNGRRNEPLRR